MGKASRGLGSVLRLLQLLPDAQKPKMYPSNGGGNYKARLDVEGFTFERNRYGRVGLGLRTVVPVPMLVPSYNPYRR